MPGRLRIEVLGPLRATAADGRDLTPNGSLQRRLLSLLVLQRGRVVSVDAAADALWPAGLPADPAAGVQNHVFRLRRLLPEGSILSSADGYCTPVEVIDVDADRLVAFVADPAAGADLRAILDRWRGPAYPELAEFDPAIAEVVRLEELRVRAVEVAAEHRLAAGEIGDLVAELQGLADAQPLRERPHALLVEALAASGRVAEALRAYDGFRRRLGDELGIEPSPELQARHARLLAGDDPPAGWVPATRLVHAANRLIGREPLLADVVAGAQQHRLVTLVGPGGVGKTRLLIEAAHALAGAHPDRPVVLCELATGDVGSAVDVVAGALGVDGRPGVSLADRITDVLGTTDLVLLLDNCEHVVEPIAALTEHVLGRCLNVTVIATSRERLRVAGERVQLVPPLGLGREDSPAVRLFVERAQAVAADFEPDAEQLDRISGIVSRLDGLPLAIELAAARLHTHDLDEVAAGLDDRFALLTSGQRTSTRHGSLGAAVAWSFGLLPPVLQTAFADLSVFAGAFTAADSAAVAGVATEAQVSALSELVERSLVLRAPPHSYVALETLRAFGADHLRAIGRAAAVAERHAEYEAEWLDAVNRRLSQPGNDALGEIELALPELRAAFGWALDHGRAELAGRICAGLFEYGFFRLRPDVLAWSERALDAVPAGPVAVDLWVAASYAAWMAGDIAECDRRARHAAELVERDGGPLPANVLTALGSASMFQGELAAAADSYHRAGDTGAWDDAPRAVVGAASELLARSYAGDTAQLAELGATMIGQVPDDTCMAAYVWYCAGEAVMGTDIDLARERLGRAIELAERTRASFVAGVAGASRASLEARLGDPYKAAEEYRRLILHWRRAGMWSTQWTMLRSIAGVLGRLGKHREAAELEGAIRATLAGHRLFGADEVALAELSRTLRTELGESAYSNALQAGATLDGDAAVELALRAL